MESNQKGTKEALTLTYQQVLSSKNHQQKEWISVETMAKIKEKKNKKTATNNS